jgi:hypothetical protein
VSARGGCAVGIRASRWARRSGEYRARGRSLSDPRSPSTERTERRYRKFRRLSSTNLRTDGFGRIRPSDGSAPSRCLVGRGSVNLNCDAGIAPEVLFPQVLSMTTIYGFRPSARREGTNAESRRAKWGCSLPNGIRSGRVFDPATLSPTKQSRPPGPSCTTGTKHQGLSGHGPPLRDHDDRRSPENTGFLTDAPSPGRRGTLYWNCAPRWAGPRYRHAWSVSWSTQRVSEPRQTRASL